MNCAFNFIFLKLWLKYNKVRKILRAFREASVGKSEIGEIQQKWIFSFLQVSKRSGIIISNVHLVNEHRLDGLIDLESSDTYSVSGRARVKMLFSS